MAAMYIHEHFNRFYGWVPPQRRQVEASDVGKKTKEVRMHNGGSSQTITPPPMATINVANV